MASILTLLLATALAVALVHIYIRASEGWGPVALADHRSMHQGSVAVGGGLPLLVAAGVAGLLIWAWPWTYLLLLPAVAGLALVSFLDDVRPVSRKVRFGAHVAAAAACIAAVPADAQLLAGLLPFWIERALVLVALVWFVNLYNFMDGIDGIAGVETVTLAGGYALVLLAALGTEGAAAAPLYGLALAVAGAAVGFLFWNWNPARIFMGDVGSVPLGLLTGVLMIDLASRGLLAAALILPLYYAADATLTLLARLKRGERVWEPHRSHFYQRSARAAGSHAIVVRRVALCNGVLVLLAIASIKVPLLASALAVLGVGALLLWMEVTATPPANQLPATG